MARSQSGWAADIAGPASERRALVAPGLGALELAGELQHQAVLAGAGGELHANRQAVLAPGERDGSGRLAGHVEDLGVRHELEQAPSITLQIQRLSAQVADRDGRAAERRGDEDVVAFEET